MKNNELCLQLGRQQIQFLQQLNFIQNINIVKLYEDFLLQNHLVLVYELLDFSLADLVKISQYQGLSLKDISEIAGQILQALQTAQYCKITHGNLIPDNILFQNINIKQIKVINFGQSYYNQTILYKSAKSIFYRAPEELIGNKFDESLDMWYLGCICAELFLGLPLFPGNSQYDQLRRIIDLLGMPVPMEIELSQHKNKFFEKVDHRWELKSQQLYEKEQNVILQPIQDYHNIICFKDFHKFYDNSIYRNEVEKSQMQNFIDFLRTLIKINPKFRPTAEEALNHSFINHRQNNEKQNMNQSSDEANCTKRKLLIQMRRQRRLSDQTLSRNIGLRNHFDVIRMNGSLPNQI